VKDLFIQIHGKASLAITRRIKRELSASGHWIFRSHDKEGIVCITSLDSDEGIDSLLSQLDMLLPQGIDVTVFKQGEEIIDAPAERPFAVGRKILVVPWNKDEIPESKHQSNPGGFVLFVRPGKAFGTGTHPSTRGCLLALEWLYDHGLLADKKVLDIGTGSGILAICAVLMGAKDVMGIDIDQEAIALARKNQHLNQCPEEILRFEKSSALEASMDDLEVVLANLVPSIRNRILKRLLCRLRPGGIVVLSGSKANDPSAMLTRHKAGKQDFIKQFLVSGWMTVVLRKEEGL